VIVGSGIDVIESERLERELERASWQAKHGIFTENEVRAFYSSRNPAILFAGCFAAKEATLKALGIEVSQLAHFREIEALPDPSGQWNLRVEGKSLSACQKLGVQRTHVAVTTSKTLCGAVVVLEA